MKLKEYLPPNRYLLLIAVVLVANFAQYPLLAATSGEDFFAGASDEYFALGYMKSAQHGFADPWTSGLIFQNPIPSPPYFYGALGLIGLAGIDLFALYLAAKIILAAAFMIAAYNILKFFVPGRHNQAFLILCLWAGLGGMIYAVTSLAHNGIAFGYEFSDSGFSHIFQHLERPYWMISEILTFAGLIAFIKKRRLAASLIIGVATLIYPNIAIAAVGGIFIYSIASQKKISIQKAILDTIPVAIAAAIFVLPWAYFYFQDRTYFILYSNFDITSRQILPLIISSFFSLAFAGYFIARKKFNQTNIRFISFFALAMIIVSLLPLNFLNPSKLSMFVSIPLAGLAAMGLEEFSGRFKIGQMKIIAAVFLVSLASMAGYHLYQYNEAHKDQGLSYIKTQDYQAMKFLATQEPGRVMSSQLTGYFLPYFSDKPSLLSKGINESNEINDTMEFFSTGNTDMFRKYGIKYIFLGTNEMKIYKIKNIFGLEMIYDNMTRIYKYS